MVGPSSGSRPGSTSRSALAALRDVGIDCTKVEPVPEQGWASWTYVVDDHLIARFPRNDDVAASTRRERRLLPALAAHVSFRVPEPVVSGDDWFAYELIPGRGLTADDDVDAALAMIRELHTFPVDEARRLLDVPPLAEVQAREWAAFEARVFPLVPDDLLARVGELRTPPLSGPETLIHADLGAEHVLVDDRGKPVGIIDFEDARIGDPEMDLMPTCVVGGRPLTEGMWRYRCRGTLHALAYYVDHDPDEVPGALEELRRRLDARPR